MCEVGDWDWCGTRSGRGEKQNGAICQKLEVGRDGDLKGLEGRGKQFASLGQLVHSAELT